MLARSLSTMVEMSRHSQISCLADSLSKLMLISREAISLYIT